LGTTFTNIKHLSEYVEVTNAKLTTSVHLGEMFKSTVNYGFSHINHINPLTAKIRKSVH